MAFSIRSKLRWPYDICVTLSSVRRRDSGFSLIQRELGGEAATVVRRSRKSTIAVLWIAAKSAAFRPESSSSITLGEGADGGIGRVTLKRGRHLIRLRRIENLDT